MLSQLEQPQLKWLDQIVDFNVASLPPNLARLHLVLVCVEHVLGQRLLTLQLILRIYERLVVVIDLLERFVLLLDVLDAGLDWHVLLLERVQRLLWWTRRPAK